MPGEKIRFSHSVKPGRGKKFEFRSRSKMRPEWADFCTKHCPHEEAVCGKSPCPEFKAAFGKVDNL